MGESDLPRVLTELPFLGPLFAGSLVAVGLRLLGLLAAIFLGLKILQYLVKPKAAPGSGPVQSVAALVRQGRLEEAGDLATREADHETALRHYEASSAWLKAGHAARRLGEHGRAGAFYERAKEIKLAAAAFETAGDTRSLARVAAKAGEPSLLVKAASVFAKDGEAMRAADLFRQAGLLAEAERCYLSVPDQGLARAAQMYVEAFEQGTGLEAGGPRARELARKAVDLLVRAGDPTKARALCYRAGLDAASLLGGEPAPSGAGAGAGSSASKPEDDLSIDAPLASLDSLATPATPATPARASATPATPATPARASATPEKATAAVVHAALRPTDPGESVPVTAVARPGRRSAPPETPPPLASDVLDRYEIIDQLGEGGMGEVYRARDRNLGRLIALKLLSPAFVGNDVAMRFFRREARAAAALNHPAIVTIYDFGVLGGRPFISMEYVEGTDLESRLAEQGPLQEQHALNLGIQVALALDFAHERKVIHRDIKPSNLLQARGGGVKILDFGLAKALHADRQGASIVAGTPSYMPPEQLAGGEMDGRVDVFALGVTLYQVLTAKTPFEGLLRTPEVDPPTTHAPWLSAGIDEPILKAIRLPPEDRYQTGREMAGALRKVLQAASSRP